MDIIIFLSILVFSWIAIKCLRVLAFVRINNIQIDSYRLYFMKALFIGSVGYAIVYALYIFNVPIVITQAPLLFKFDSVAFGALFCIYMQGVEHSIIRK